MKKQSDISENQALVHDLIAALKNRSKEIRALAANLLGKYGEQAQAAILDLLILLQDEDENVRLSSACTLAKLKAKPDIVVPFLCQFLSQGGDVPGLHYPSTAYRAVNALADFGPLAASATVVLLDIALDARVGYLRKSAAEALGQIGSAARSTCRSLADMLGSSICPISFDSSLLHALEQIGPSRASVPALVKALNLPNNCLYPQGPSRYFQIHVPPILAAMGADAVEAIPALESILALPTEEEFYKEKQTVVTPEEPKKRGRSRSIPSQPESTPERYTYKEAKAAVSKAINAIEKAQKNKPAHFQSVKSS